MAKGQKKRDQSTSDNQSSPLVEDNNEDATLTVVSPLKKTKTNGKKIVAWYFALKDGNFITCKTNEEATFYSSEYENLITDQQTFTDEADYSTFMKKQQSTDKNENDKKKKTKAEKEQAKKKARLLAADIIETAKQNKPKNKLLIVYKAIPVCTKVIVVVNYLNMRAQHLFYAKPRNLHDYTKNYLEKAGYSEIDINRDDTVVDMIKNMAHYRQRNPDAGPDSIVVTINKINGRKYEEELTVTELDIPPSVTTREEEQQFLTEKLTLFGQTLLQIQATETFKEIMIEVLPEGLTKWMYGKDAKYSFTEWCQTAEISVERCNNLNTWITLEDANKLKMKMAQHRCLPRYSYDANSAPTVIPPSVSSVDSSVNLPGSTTINSV